MTENRLVIAGEQPPPEPPKGRFVRIIAATQTTPARIVVGHPIALGRYIHWARRGLLCGTGGEVCNCKLQKYPRRWYAFLVGWDATDKKRAVLQIPWHSYRVHQWPHDCTDPNHLIGRTVTAVRTTTHPKSPVSLVCGSQWQRSQVSILSYQEAEQWIAWAYDHVSPEFESEGELQ